MTCVAGRLLALALSRANIWRTVLFCLLATFAACESPGVRTETLLIADGCTTAGSPVAGAPDTGGSNSGGDTAAGSSGTDSGGSAGVSGSDTGGVAGTVDTGGSGGSAVTGTDTGGVSGTAGSEQGGTTASGGDNTAGEAGAAGAPPVDPRRTVIVFYGGQSNCSSPANDAAGFPPGPASDPDVLTWITIGGRSPAVDSNTFGPLQRVADRTYGAEQTLGRLLKRENRRVVVIKVARGSTYIQQWVTFPPGVPAATYSPYYEPLLLTELDAARAALDALPPYGEESCHFVWDQGEEDARAALKKYPPQLADRWNEALGYLQASVEQHLRCPMARHVMLTNAALPQGATRQLSIVRAQQMLSPRVISSDDVPVLGDGVHYTGAGQGIRGQRIAASIEAVEAMR